MVQGRRQGCGESAGRQLTDGARGAQRRRENLQRAVRAADISSAGEAIAERRRQLGVATGELQPTLRSDTRLHIRRAMSTKPSTGEKPGDEVVVATEK